MDRSALGSGQKAERYLLSIKKNGELDLEAKLFPMLTRTFFENTNLFLYELAAVSHKKK